MKQFLLFILTLGIFPLVHGQTIASINSGAVSNNNFIYSVGEVFVTPTNQNEASSGIIGVISRIEFISLNINNIDYSEELKFYPNPTSSSIFFETVDKKFDTVFIYDLNGRFIESKKVVNNQIDFSNIETGTYLIKTDNQNIQSFKIIKK